MPLAATRAPYTLFIVDDDMPLNPREDYDCLGKMVCWHGRYSLGEKHDFEEPRDFLKDLLFSEYSSSHDPAGLLGEGGAGGAPPPNPLRQ